MATDIFLLALHGGIFCPPLRVIDSPESSPIHAMSDGSGVEQSSVISYPGDTKTNVSLGTGKLQVKENVSPEPLLEQMAKHVVTLDSFSDAQSYYRKRIGKDQHLLEVNAVQYIT